MSESVAKAPNVTEQFLRARSGHDPMTVRAPGYSTLPLDRSDACRWTR
jgi:hypothetical protein